MPKEEQVKKMERLINGETTTSNKKRKRKTPLSTPIASLPDDLLLVIIARIPILFYPILSLVSKRFRSLLASPRLYEVRSRLGHRESRLYVCINIYPYKNGPSWFTLCRKPDRTSSNKEDEEKSSSYVLARVPILHSPLLQDTSIVAIGSDIYGVTQSFHKASSSSVSVLDCRSHTWREAPRLPVEVFTVTASVLDQKIYLAGLYKDDVSDSLKNSFTVLDTKTQVCDPVPIPCSLAQGKHFTRSTCVGGKVNLVAGWGRVVDYNPVEDSWEEAGDTMCQHMFSKSFCQIDDVLYSCCGSDRVFRWYHTEVRTWRNLEGLVGLPKLPRDAFVRLADYGGKLAVLWNNGYGRWKGLWCAEIALERRNTCEIWGKVEWFEHVLSVPSLRSFDKALSATL